jgi:UDP-2,4-diacetamido-2,4,6-trideoxy-beta-L-altropyranose hydrolase
MDEYNVTSDVMLAIESAVHRCLISSALNLHVVVGKTNPNQREVQRHCARLDRLPKISARLYVQVTDMAGLLARMNLAIAAGGTHTWERCCLGIPTATIAVADNQVGVAEQMALASASVYLGQSHRFSLPQWSESIADFLSDTQAHTKMRLTSLALVDGKGANRVASLILGNAQSSAA